MQRDEVLLPVEDVRLSVFRHYQAGALPYGPRSCTTRCSFYA